MPYYWKRGLIAGLVVGVTLHLLLQQLAAGHPALAEGNIPMDVPASRQQQQAPHAPTPLGPLMGLVIFVLCCVMPGPTSGRLGS